MKNADHEQTLKARHLTAHLAWAADDICATLAAVLAALEAQETLECTKEAVFGSSSSSETLSVVLLVALTVLGRSRVHSTHLDGSLGLVGGSFGSGLHVVVECDFWGKGRNSGEKSKGWFSCNCEGLIWCPWSHITRQNRKHVPNDVN